MGRCEGFTTIAQIAKVLLRNCDRMSYKRLMEVHMIAKRQISDALRREIEVRAYLMWEGEGRPHGCEREHWARAEAEVLGAVAVKVAASAKKPAKSNAKAAITTKAASTSKAAIPAKAAVAAKVVVATKTKKTTKPKSPR
jgi:hypothetical protein